MLLSLFDSIRIVFLQEITHHDAIMEFGQRVQKNDTAGQQKASCRVTTYVYHRVGEYRCK